MPLNTSSNIAAPDEFYAMLIDAHDGLGDDESAALNARLILLLANHIGDADVVAEALRAAKRSAHSRAGGSRG